MVTPISWFLIDERTLNLDIVIFIIISPNFFIFNNPNSKTDKPVSNLNFFILFPLCLFHESWGLGLNSVMGKANIWFPTQFKYGLKLQSSIYPVPFFPTDSSQSHICHGKIQLLRF